MMAPGEAVQGLLSDGLFLVMLDCLEQAARLQLQQGLHLQ